MDPLMLHYWITGFKPFSKVLEINYLGIPVKGIWKEVNFNKR
jgi:hypothetical protein